MKRISAVVLVALIAGVLTLQRTDLQAYVLNGPSWTSSPVRYYVNPANTNGLSDAAVIAAFQTASSAWSTQTQANISLAYGGTTTIGTVGRDGTNAMFFRPDANGGVAATTYTWWDSSNHLTEADMVIWESDYQFFTGTSGCVYGLYLEDIATHEFGHVLGLGHSTVATATMYPYFYTPCFQDFRSLDPDDIAGVEALYPPSTVSAPSLPAAPSQLVVAASASNPSGSIVLSWVAATNASGYVVERSTDGVAFSPIAQPGATATGYTDSGLAPGATYYYRVDAYNSAGSSAYSNVAWGQTQVLTSAPSAPTGPSPADGATSVNASATLQWTACSLAQTYDVYLDTSATPALWAAGVTGTSLSVSLTAGTTYYWRIVARNSAGATAGSTWSFTTKAATTKTTGVTRKKH
jgi:hypothetical protein